MDLLRELKVLDSPPEEVFDNLAKLAIDLFNVPVSLISIVDFDNDRQFFKSRIGLAEPWQPVARHRCHTRFASVS